MHAHNDYLELVYDLGLIGLAWLPCSLRPVRTAQFGPVGPGRIAVEACFAFPSHLPATLAIAALAAGHAVRDRAVVRRVALTAEILAIQGSQEPHYDKAMAWLDMAARVMPLDYRFRQYAYIRSIGGTQDGTLQSK